MKISDLIDTLEAAKKQYGDLPVFTIDSDISSVNVYPVSDGVERIINGVRDTPNELVLEFISG
jgi:hypothetical protein